jgi:solute:Na+ symporter, SSS family
LIPTTPNAVTSLLIGTYLAATISVGMLVRRKSITSSQFLHARRAPTAVTAIAFLAANCGALEIVGIVAASAKYGALALHFYWLGAIPAMLFLALFMMPVYARSGAMTVPDFRSTMSHTQVSRLDGAGGRTRLACPASPIVPPVT